MFGWTPVDFDMKLLGHVWVCQGHQAEQELLANAQVHVVLLWIWALVQEGTEM